MASKMIKLTEQQLNCPHPNIRVTHTMEPDSGSHNGNVYGKVFSICDTCGAQFWNTLGEEEYHIIGYDDSKKCVDCESKGISHMDMLRGTATPMSTPEEAVTKDTAPPKISSDNISNIIVSHDINDPKFQRHPQYSPHYPPKGGDEEARSVDKRGNRIRKKQQTS